MGTARTLSALRRRLEQWELEHLRRLSTELHERLERAEEDARRAWESADNWQAHAMALQEELWDAGGEIGITKEGDLLVLKSDAGHQLLEAAQAAEAVLAKQKWRPDSTDPEAVALQKLRAAIAAFTPPGREG